MAFPLLTLPLRWPYDGPTLAQHKVMTAMLRQHQENSGERTGTWADETGGDLQGENRLDSAGSPRHANGQSLRLCLFNCNRFKNKSIWLEKNLVRENKKVNQLFVKCVKTAS